MKMNIECSKNIKKLREYVYMKKRINFFRNGYIYEIFLWLWGLRVLYN